MTKHGYFTSMARPRRVDLQVGAAPCSSPSRKPRDQDRNHPHDEPVFFAQVIGALEGAEKILIMGPSVTKFHFLKYAQEHAKAVASHIVGLETADHPTDPQLVAHVRHYFHSEKLERASLRRSHAGPSCRR